MAVPWKKVTAVEERRRFVALASVEDGSPIAELARHFGISRKTAYKWIRRYAELGMEGCGERSRAPRRSPTAFPPLVRKRLLKLRKRHPTWGPRKLVHLHSVSYPRAPQPAVATVGRWLAQAGMVRKRWRRSENRFVQTSKMTKARRPNHVWCIDFKGEFKLLNGQYCYPLTITDAKTRFLIACVALPGVHGEPVAEVMERVFETFGLPDIIRSDNGTPFVADGIYGLTRVSAPWVRYGIVHERTRKSSPQDNGGHERFHRTLKESATIPPAAGMLAQQRAFDRFRREYNWKRPHEALGMDTPGSQYSKSRKKKLGKLLAYPAHFYLCRADQLGRVNISGRHFFIGSWASREQLALEEVGHQQYRLYFAFQPLGELSLKKGTVTSYGKKGTAARPKNFDMRHNKSTASRSPPKPPSETTTTMTTRMRKTG